MSRLRRYRDSALPGPARRSTRATELILKIRDPFVGFVDLFVSIVELALRLCDFRSQPIFAVVHVTLAEKLGIQLLDLEIEELSVVFGFLECIARLLKFRPPVFFISTLIIDGARRFGFCSGVRCRCCDLFFLRGMPTLCLARP